MLEINNLTKKYKNSKFYSVKNLSFKIREGEIFGFLGKNGAGKSTTIKCLTGILPFNEGEITICGHCINKEPILAKLNVGYVPDNHAVYDNLTGREYVNYMGNIYRVPKHQIDERIEFFGNKFNMMHAVDNQIRGYSHGMKQKICIIAALIHEPKFWVLDEPLMGLDPQSVFEIREYMKEHKKKGNSVFFSSHNIDMVEKLCDRVAIINRGQLMEVIEVKKFIKESEVSLEDYFLQMTKENKAKVIMVDKKEKRRLFRKMPNNLNKAELKNLKEDETKLSKSEKKIKTAKTKKEKKPKVKTEKTKEKKIKEKKTKEKKTIIKEKKAKN